MYINYFIPVFKENVVKNFLEQFLKSDFCKKNEKNKFIFCCSKTDTKNLKYLKDKSKTLKNLQILTLENDFSYNDAFDFCTKEFDGDIVLLGDLNIEKLDLVFEKCLEKHKKGAKVVHVVKRYKGIKGFFINILQHFYNFFINIFTNKKDRLNAISLGLIDKDIVDLLKVLPKKRCYLKNTKNLLGFETRSVYISEKTILYKPNFKEKTVALKTTIISTCVFVLNLLLIIILNCTLKVPTVINIFLIILAFISFVLICMFLPKHIFDVRNQTSIGYINEKEKK